MASSLIPGNENAIYRVINELTRWGANVVHKGNAKVHVSGHASAGELAYCYNIIRPSNVLPVHGEWRHLRANADIAIRTGVDPERVLIAQDGSVIDLVDGRARITGTVPAGLVYVDAMTVGGATEETLHVRRTLAEEGVVTIVCIIDPDTGKLTEDPDYLAHGFQPEAMDFSAATPAIQAALTKAARDGIEDLEQIEELVRRAASDWAHREHRRSPLDHPRHRRRLTAHEPRHEPARPCQGIRWRPPLKSAPEPDQKGSRSLLTGSHSPGHMHVRVERPLLSGERTAVDFLQRGEPAPQIGFHPDGTSPQVAMLAHKEQPDPRRRRMPERRWARLPSGHGPQHPCPSFRVPSSRRRRHLLSSGPRRVEGRS